MIYKNQQLQKRISCLSFILLCMLFNYLNAQHLKITTDKHLAFAEALSVKYPAYFPVANSIKEYDVEKIKQLCYDKISELNSSEKELFFDLLNQYDHKKLEFVKLENIEKVDSIFYRYSDEETENQPYKSKEPILKYFYKNPHHFLSIEAENFSLRANPLAQLSYGNANNYTGTVFKNTRGAEVSGYIDNKIYFYTKILENQEGFLPYVNQYIKSNSAIPQNGLYKIYKSSVLDSLQGYDYLNAQAYIGIPISKSISLEIGHGRHKIGNGIRSLLLSDFSNNYFFLKFNTKVWKLHYQNIFAELNSISANANPGDELLPKKYMANHYLSIKPFKNFEVGLFESVIFSRQNQFELQYLNPVILYRMAEQFLGSSDNALLGLNFNYNVAKKAMIYGQIMLDEFNLELFKKDGWFGNKQGYQIGIKYPNLLSVKNLNAQLEYNTVRPYTYSHNRPADANISVSSYSHYGLPLAHPLGANLKEIIFTLNYQPTSKFNADLTIARMSVGRDKDNKNYGSNIFINTNSHFQDFNNSLLQGERNDINFVRLNASYEVFKNYKLFINPQYRKSMSQDKAYNYSNVFLGGGVTINLDIEKNIY